MVFKRQSLLHSTNGQNIAPMNRPLLIWRLGDCSQDIIKLVYILMQLQMLTDEKEKCEEEDGKDEIEEVHTEGRIKEDLTHETVDQKTGVTENEADT